MELCGGTHVEATGQIGLFKILSETAISAGVRRIEAVSGLAALQTVRRMEHQLTTVAETLKASPDELLPRLERLLAQERELEKEVQVLKSSSLRDQFDDIAKTARSVGGIRLVSHRIDNLDEKQLREVADRLKDSAQLGVVVIATVREGKVSFVVSVAKDVTSRNVHAGHLAKEFAALLQGSGGGRPDFAQGGGKNPEALDAALAQVETLLKNLLTKK
jgi:alanyl-tRNA synthetase